MDPDHGGEERQRITREPGAPRQRSRPTGSSSWRCPLGSRMVSGGRSPTGRGRALKPSPVRVRIPPPPPRSRIRTSGQKRGSSNSLIGRRSSRAPASSACRRRAGPVSGGSRSCEPKAALHPSGPFSTFNMVMQATCTLLTPYKLSASPAAQLFHRGPLVAHGCAPKLSSIFGAGPKRRYPSLARPTTSACRGTPPIDPWYLADPNAKRPPSPPTSQYPAPSGALLMATTGRLRIMPPIEP